MIFDLIVWFSSVNYQKEKKVKAKRRLCSATGGLLADPHESLGISIVGGRTVIKRLKNGEELKGIFIKQVSGVDLQNASHEEAVQAIKAAVSPVIFIVQSLSSTPR
ncbi:hypothetical protein DNTS_010183, partial [Danionella cerebrum]